MYPDKDRVASLLQNALDELDLLQKMSAGINTPDLIPVTRQILADLQSGKN